jgi:hypothetical protein
MAIYSFYSFDTMAIYSEYCGIQSCRSHSEVRASFISGPVECDHESMMTLDFTVTRKKNSEGHLLALKWSMPAHLDGLGWQT